MSLFEEKVRETGNKSPYIRNTYSTGLFFWLGGSNYFNQSSNFQAKKPLHENSIIHMIDERYIYYNANRILFLLLLLNMHL